MQFFKRYLQLACDIYMDYDLERKQLSSEKIVKFINSEKTASKKLIFNEKKD